MNLKSKGVSPIVAVVLLITATIAIGTILMAWGSGLIQERQSISEETSKSVFGSENYLSIDNLADSNGTLLIWIRNSGDEDVNVEYFRIYIEKNEVDQDPQNVSGMTVPKKDTVKLAEIPLSLEEGDIVFVKITTKSGYLMTKILNLTPKVTSTLTPSPTTPPANLPPNADFDYDPPNPYTDEVIQFTDLSTDSDGIIVSWDWDFGDSQTSSNQNPTHSYPENITYTVTSTVTDDDGATDSISKDITVLNQNPVADANGPYFGIVGEDITFDGSGSYDPDGSIVSWDWDFGDTTSGSGETTTHAYTNLGDYTVTLTVTDDDGGTDTDTTTVDVSAAPANFNILTIDTNSTEIKQGDTGIVVTMTVENTGGAVALVTNTDLTFTHLGGDVSIEYTVTPDPFNPISIAGGTSETFTFAVDCVYDATTGVIVIDGYIGGIDTATGMPISDNTAITIDQWYVEFFDDVEHGSGKWSISPDLLNLWHVTQHRYHSSDHSWYFGQEGIWNYDVGNCRGSIISVSIDLTSPTITSAELKFWTWWQIEHARPNRDRMQVYVSANGGPWGPPEWLRDSGDPDMGWHEETIDLLGYMGDSIEIRFYFNATDHNNNDYEGWYVDDIHVDVTVNFT